MTDWKERAERAEAELARLRAVEPDSLDAACMREQVIDEYLCDYTMDGDDSFHLPTESELALIKDAIMGLLVDPKFLASFAAPPAQPAEPVQRLSDERAAFEAWHNEYRTQELVRRDDTYYNTHVRCRWEGWQARAIESALQPGWRPEWPAFVEYWTHESHLQTFADRERFRAAAKAMLEAAPKATK